MSSQYRLCYITDVEGNLEYFKKCIALTGDVFYEDTEETVLSLKDDVIFVFGGDAFDKGPWDIRFGNQLVALKKRYPERVVLIIGNRDINKSKLAAELDESDLARPVESITGPWWVAEASRVTYKSYLQKLISSQEGTGEDGQDYSPEHYQKYHNRITRTKWLLIQTMGCPDTFEYRRTELAELAGKTVSEISDQEVADSFYFEATKPEGVYRQYLELAQLCFIHGNTIICHGAITDLSFLFLPGEDNQDNKQTSEQIERQDYTVIINGYLKNGNPEPVSPELSAQLHNFGISRVLVGHKPHGDSPTVIKGNDFEVITVDTSYSDPKAEDNRGQAISLVTIIGDLEAGTSYASAKGCLQTGEPYSYSLPTIDGQGREIPSEGADPLVGRCLDGWWVRVPLQVGDQKNYVLGKGQSRAVNFKRLSEEELKEALAL